MKNTSRLMIDNSDREKCRPHNKRKQKQNTDSSITTGGRLNKKDGLTRYGDSHVKDKTS